MFVATRRRVAICATPPDLRVCSRDDGTGPSSFGIPCPSDRRARAGSPALCCAVSCSKQTYPRITTSAWTLGVTSSTIQAGGPKFGLGRRFIGGKSEHSIMASARRMSASQPPLSVVTLSSDRIAANPDVEARHWSPQAAVDRDGAQGAAATESPQHDRLTRVPGRRDHGRPEPLIRAATIPASAGQPRPDGPWSLCPGAPPRHRAARRAV
jgi:hypothetical protein